MEVNVQIPQALAPVFAPAIGAVAYRGAYGGRGSAKTRTFARMVAVRALVFETMGLRGAILCGREFMGSLADSSMEELKSVIQEDDWLASHFSIGKEYIRTKSGNIWFLFVGLRHNLDSLKSKAKVLLTWIDEAENVSELAWRKLIATVMREPNSEIWLTWNPESEESATHKRFRVSYDPKRMVIVECNYSDNPWFPQGLEDERKADLEFRPDTYDHIWEGQFLTLTEAQIMAGKYEIKEFEVDGPGWQGPYLGGDFGYSQDPTAAVRAWVKDNCLYIDYEAGGTRIEIDDIVSRVSASIPEYDKHVSRWDSAQPGMISHIQRKGFHRAIGCVKGKGSVEDGIQFIRSFKRVYIHPRCVQTAREFRLYSWEIDKLSGAIKPKPVDANNHYCISEGQRVLTKRGQIPIESVVVGDMAMTRKGWRKVLAAHVTGHNKPVVKVSTTIGDLVCTPDHPVLRNTSFTRADTLCYGDEVTGSKSWLKQQSGTERNITVGRNQNAGQIEFISSAVSKAVSSIYTEPFGKVLTAQFQKVLTFIMSMKTQATTQLKTLSALLEKNIFRATQCKAKDTITKLNTLHQSTIWQRLGTQLQKASKCIGGSVQWHINHLCQLKKNVITAKINSCQKNLATLTCFAPMRVSRQAVAHPALIMFGLNALFAKIHSKLTNTQKQKHVVGHVLTVTDHGYASKVYNLLIDGENEFIAEGVIVHNCDALRYALNPIMKHVGINWAALGS